MDAGGRGSKSRIARVTAGMFALALIAALLLPYALSTSGASGASAGPAPARAVEDPLDLAFRYISVGWIDSATVQLKEATRSRPEAVDAHLILGMAEEALGDREAALAAYERAAKAARGRADGEGSAMALAGNLLFSSGRILDAKEAFLRAEKVAPGKALIRFGLGRVAEAEGDTDAALDWYTKAAEASPGWIEPAVRAGRLLTERGEIARAAELFATSSSAGTRHPEYQYQLGLVYVRLLEAVRGGSLSPGAEEALKTLGIPGEGREEELIARVVHAADRLRQLAPDHPGAESLLSAIGLL